jgi:hypothetical protein
MRLPPRRSWVSLLAGGAFALVALGALLLIARVPVPSPVRIVLAMLLVFVLPGAALAPGLLHPRSTTPATRLAAIVVMSIGVAVLGGLALNATDGGLSKSSWALLIVLVAVCGNIASVVLARRRGVRFDVARPPRVRIRDAGVLAAAVAVACAGVLVARDSAATQERDAPGFTELWLAPPQRAGAPLRVSIRSHEDTVQSFRLEIRDQRHHLLQRAMTIALRPGQTHQTTVSPSLTGHADVVDATLFRAGSSTAYRRVRWFTTRPAR